MLAVVAGMGPLAEPVPLVDRFIVVGAVGAENNRVVALFLFELENGLVELGEDVGFAVFELLVELVAVLGDLAFLIFGEDSKVFLNIFLQLESPLDRLRI